MISDVTSYLNKLAEIQNSNLSTVFMQTPEEPQFIIDANTRTITVPTVLKNVGVKNDHNAETIYFNIDRYFDNEDLNNHICVIHYINAQKEPDIYPVTLKDLSVDGKIIFGWKISNHVTQSKGEVTFAVRFYTLNEDNSAFVYNWNTVPATFNILDGLDVSSSIGTIEADLLSQAVNSLNAVLNNANNRLQSIDDAILESRMVYKEPVNTYDVLSTTYTDAEEGWVVKVIGDSKIYRFTKGEWRHIDTVSMSTYDSLYNKFTAQLATKATQTEVDVLKAQQNLLIAHAGDESNNTEIIDGRVGANGIVYPTIGEANREQIRQLNEGLMRLNTGFYKFNTKNLYYGISTGWKLTGVNGLCSSDSGYSMVKYRVNANTKIKIIASGLYQYQSNASVPASGTNPYLIGGTKISTGIAFDTVPVGATFIILNADVGAEDTVSVIEVKELPETIEKDLNNEFLVKKFDKANIMPLDADSWNQGNFGFNFTPSNNLYRIYSDPIPVDAGATYIFKSFDDTFEMYVLGFTTNTESENTNTEAHEWITDKEVKLKTTTNYLVIVLRDKASSGNKPLTPDNVADLKILLYKKGSTKDERLSSVGSTIHVMTYNMGMFNYGISNGYNDAETMAEKFINWKRFFGKANVHIAGLQEKRNTFDVGEAINTNTEMLDYFYPYYSSQDTTHLSWAVIELRSSIEIEKPQSLRFNVSNRTYVKGYITVNGKRILIMNVHLSPTVGMTPEEAVELRKQEAEEILEAVENEDYAIIFGDFNPGIGISEFDIYKNAGLDLANGGFFGVFDTYINTSNPTQKMPLDNIIVKNLKILSVERLDYAWDMCTSDHYPLYAKLQII